MKLHTTLIASALCGLFGVPVFAQTAGTEVQRDTQQQQRIEQGLKSGELSTGEAARLEKGEAHVDHMEARDMKNGSLSPTEQARIQSAQNRESAAIANDKHNGITGNPNSASSQRMQADVQRNVNQQQRIENGINSGQLNNHQVGVLEHEQKRVDNAEARAGKNSHVSAAEQAKIQDRENHQSKRIEHKKQDQ